jgi:hypothetical protein
MLRPATEVQRCRIVLKLLQDLNIAVYEIMKKPSKAGFAFDTPGGDGSV